MALRASQNVIGLDMNRLQRITQDMYDKKLQEYRAIQEEIEKNMKSLILSTLIP